MDTSASFPGTPLPASATDETLAALTLSYMGPHWLAPLWQLHELVPSWADIVRHHHCIRSLVPQCPERLAQALACLDEPRRRAEEQLLWAGEAGVSVIDTSQARYPRRLLQCPDAPLALFYKGRADLNARRIVSVVGTRRATCYADDCLRRLLDDLRAMCSDVLVVSGLAYGVDIKAHRLALDHGLMTVGVLAHGLDTLYPSRHRAEAARMVGQGGLLTEYGAHTHIDKVNFVRRNRIVAGMADATILVESADKGGGLITCALARGYGREVMAFPGNVGQPYSEGCNRLIRDAAAQLVTSGRDVAEALGWPTQPSAPLVAQEARKASVAPEALPVVEALRAQNDQHIDLIASMAHLPVGQATALLFRLEMDGVVAALSGGRYHLKE